MYKLFVTLFILVTPMYAIKVSAYHEFTAKCMGTDFNILIDHDNEKLSAKAAAAAFAEANRLNKIFSDYIKDSEISLLSESSYSGKKIKLSDELFEVLKYSKSLAFKTDGAFDPTIGQLSRLWRISRFRKNLPTDKSLLRALSLKGIGNLQLSEKTKEAVLKKPGVILDLGGIAKGYATDRMLVILNKFGINRCIIDAGGDLRLGYKPRGKSGWTIKIGGQNHPDLPTLSLEQCSVATSGDYSQFVEINGTRYSHILNPHTGYGLKNLSQITVICENGMKADSLATACSVLGLDRIKKLSKSENFKAFVISQISDEQVFEVVD